MSALAVIALLTGAGIAIHSGMAAYGAIDPWRQWTFGIGAGLGLYTAGAYFVVLFVDATANVAWLRPAILFWMVHYLVVMRVVATVVATSPSEQMAAENKRLNGVIEDAKSLAQTFKGIADQYKEREAKWTAEKERMVADATTIRKALEAEREAKEKSAEKVLQLQYKAGQIFEEKMKLEEKINQLEVQILQLGGDIDG